MEKVDRGLFNNLRNRVSRRSLVKGATATGGALATLGTGRAVPEARALQGASVLAGGALHINQITATGEVEMGIQYVTQPEGSETFYFLVDFGASASRKNRVAEQAIAERAAALHGVSPADVAVILVSAFA